MGRQTCEPHVPVNLVTWLSAMSTSLKVAGIVCLSLMGENNAFTISSAPAARFSAAQPAAMSPATRPPRIVSLRMQQQQSEGVKVLDNSSGPEASKLVGNKNPEEKSMKEALDLSEEKQEDTVLETKIDVKAEVLEEMERGTEQVRGAVAATRKKISGASSPLPKANTFAATAIKVGALKENSPLLTSDLVGNKGFDPLNIAKDEGLLRQYREAEIKHGRLAMLASVGWVASELLHPSLSTLLNKPSLLATTAAGVQEKAPALLNGGLEKVPTWFWGVIVVVSAVSDISRMISISEKPLTFTPGALGFDPLNFYTQADAKERKDLQLKELNNGRLAMIGIASFAVKEYLFDAAIVKQSPELFTQGPLSYAFSIPALLLQYTGLFSCQTGLTYCAQGDTDVIKAIMSTSDAGVAEQAEYINSIMGTSLFL